MVGSYFLLRADGRVGMFRLHPFYSLATLRAFYFHGDFQTLAPNFSISVGFGIFLLLLNIGSRVAIAAGHSVFLHL